MVVFVIRNTRKNGFITANDLGQTKRPPSWYANQTHREKDDKGKGCLTRALNYSSKSYLFPVLQVNTKCITYIY